MRGVSEVTAILAVVATLLTGGGVIYSAYDLNSRGQSPKKNINVTYFGAVNALEDLSSLGPSLSLSIKNKDQELDNIQIIQTQLENAGSVPVLPSDIFKNLSISVSDPWHIVAVANFSAIKNIFIPLQWSQISETEFEAAPALLNPGDKVWVKVYITNPRYPSEVSAPKIQWNGRIANLKSFANSPDLVSQLRAKQWGAVVDLSGWSLIFTISIFIIFNLLYILLIFRAGFFSPWRWISVILLFIRYTPFSFCI